MKSSKIISAIIVVTAMLFQSTSVFAATSSDAKSAVFKYEAARIDTQPNITSANALGSIAQTAVGQVTDTLTKDELQARIVAKNIKIATAVVAVNISTVNAFNGTITITYNNALTAAPTISAFNVTQTIDTGVATKVVPTAVVLDLTGKIVTLTVPQVATTATAQNVIYTVSYDTAVPVTAKTYSVAAATVQGPSFQNVSLNTTNKIVTIAFDKPLISNVTDLKSVIKFATNGTIFNTLGASDSVSISCTDAKKIIVTFRSPLKGVNNKIQIAANSLKDANGNVQTSVETTSSISSSIHECVIPTTVYGSRSQQFVVLLSYFRSYKKPLINESKITQI